MCCWLLLFFSFLDWIIKNIISLKIFNLWICLDLFDIHSVSEAVACLLAPDGFVSFHRKAFLWLYSLIPL